MVAAYWSLSTSDLQYTQGDTQRPYPEGLDLSVGEDRAPSPPLHRGYYDSAHTECLKREVSIEMKTSKAPHTTNSE